MLNPKTKQRELCYIVKIDKIEPITGSDNCESARVGGWSVMVRKGTFKEGDLAIYFEVDSKVDTTKSEFSFMERYHGKIKTQRYTFGGKNPGFYSQGLLMHPSDFGWEVQVEPLGGVRTEVAIDDEGKAHYPDDESRFLTKKLGVVYSVVEDNKRKGKTVDKYKRMVQRLGKKADTPIFKWLYEKNWGKKLLFFFYGNKKEDGRLAWPSHICSKTDVERIQNAMYFLEDKNVYVATEKIDGSSFTVAAEKKRFGKIKYYVCSRNVVFEDEKEDCFYDKNIYYEAYYKYNLKEKITRLLNDYNLKNVAIQMEIYGEGIQKRDYSTKEHKIAVFHIVSDREKFSMDRVVELCHKYDIPHVPIIDPAFFFPETLEELQAYVEGAPSKIDGKEKEGIVFYDKATGQKYIKFVSPKFLIKYH